MNVSIEIPYKLINDMIITALEQGIGYWASKVTLFDNGLPEKQVSRITDDPTTNLSYLIITEGEELKEHRLVFSEISTRFTEQHRVRNFSQIVRGLEKMASQYPRHFANVVLDDHDAETADVFMQCCVLEKVVYG